MCPNLYLASFLRFRVQTRFPNNDFPNGKLKKTESGDRVLEIVCFAMAMQRDFAAMIVFRLAKHGGFGARFPTLKMDAGAGESL